MSIPASVPFPRKDGVISFAFSPRILPTPKRESKSAEEEEVGKAWKYITLKVYKIRGYTRPVANSLCRGR